MKTSQSGRLNSIWFGHGSPTLITHYLTRTSDLLGGP